jgi:hypothetical protein
MSAILILCAAMFALPFVVAWCDNQTEQRDHEERMAKLEIERLRLLRRGGYQPVEKAGAPNPPPKKL